MYCILWPNSVWYVGHIYTELSDFYWDCPRLNRLVLKKEDLDDAFKDKKFPENSKVELLFERDTDRLHGLLLTGFFVGAGLGKKTCMYT